MLLLLSNVLLFGQTKNKTPLETKSVFEVQVNSKKYTVEEGNELEIDGELKNPKITIKILDKKKFNAGNLQFQYPSNFSFEVEKSEGYSSWTLDGNDYVVMIFDLDEITGIESFTDGMISSFGEENCRTKKIKTKLGDKTLSGIQLFVELVGQKLTIDLYEYSTSENNSKYIVFQDILEEDGTSTIEGVNAFKMISETIQYN